MGSVAKTIAVLGASVAVIVAVLSRRPPASRRHTQ